MITFFKGWPDTLIDDEFTKYIYSRPAPSVTHSAIDSPEILWIRVNQLIIINGLSLSITAPKCTMDCVVHYWHHGILLPHGLWRSVFKYNSYRYILLIFDPFPFTTGRPNSVGTIFELTFFKVYFSGPCDQQISQDVSFEVLDNVDYMKASAVHGVIWAYLMLSFFWFISSVTLITSKEE